MSKYKVDVDKEYKIGGQFKKIFHKMYHQLTEESPRCRFAFSNKLIQQGRYIYVARNPIIVYINPLIADLEGPRVLSQNAQRAALKVFLINRGRDYRERSKDYQTLAKKYNLYYYGDLYETPQKMALYTCSECGRPVAIYTKPLPNNSPMIGAILPDHTKNGRGGRVHQGRIAFHGVEMVNNKTLQDCLFFMEKMCKLLAENGEFKHEYIDKRETDIFGSWF